MGSSLGAGEFVNREQLGQTYQQNVTGALNAWRRRYEDTGGHMPGEDLSWDVEGLGERLGEEVKRAFDQGFGLEVVVGEEGLKRRESVGSKAYGKERGGDVAFVVNKYGEGQIRLSR